MAITMTYEEMVNLQVALATVADLSEKEHFPVELDVWFLRLIKKSKAPMIEYTEIRDKLLRQYGTEIFIPAKDKFDKDNKPIMISTNKFEMTSMENKDKFTESLKELNAKECEIEGNVFQKSDAVFAEEKIPRLSLKTQLFLAPCLVMSDDLKVADKVPPEIEPLDENKVKEPNKV